MRVVISAGGTGGHLYPAIALANELRSLDRENDILFVTGKSDLEKTLVRDAGYAIKSIEIHGFRRKLSPDFFRTAYRSQRGYRQAKEFLSSFLPHIAVGFGGAISFPVILAASRNSIPTLIHEQNLVPGLSNRILSRYANTVAVSFEESVRHFANARYVLVTGNPIRSGLFTRTSEDEPDFGLEKSRKTVLAFGGSQGAVTINTAIAGIYPLLKDRDDLNIFHITGENDHDRVVSLLDEKRTVSDRLIYKTVPYLDKMGRIYRVSDLAVCRAGAGTIAELTAFGIPAILVPYPYAAGGHQAQNAGVLESKGAAIIIENERLDSDVLLGALNATLSDTTRLEKMRNASRSLGRPEAVADLARAVVSTARM